MRLKLFAQGTAAFLSLQHGAFASGAPAASADVGLASRAPEIASVLVVVAITAHYVLKRRP